MVTQKQALRVHYKNPGGGFPGEVYIAKLGAGQPGADHGAVTNRMARLMHMIRESREVGDTILSHDDLMYRLAVDHSTNSYVSCAGPQLSLIDCLGYVTASSGVAEDVVRVQEIGVREDRIRKRSHLLVTAAMLAPVLEDLAPEGGPRNFSGVDLAIVSPYPSAFGRETMQELGLRRVEAGFRGPAEQVYEKIGALGLTEIPLSGGNIT